MSPIGIMENQTERDVVNLRRILDQVVAQDQMHVGVGRAPIIQAGG